MTNDRVAFDAYLKEIAADVGVRVTAGHAWEATVMSDVFMNCGFINGLADDERQTVVVAAEKFNQALPEPYKSRYTVEWLVEDFFERL